MNRHTNAASAANRLSCFLSGMLAICLFQVFTTAQVGCTAPTTQSATGNADPLVFGVPTSQLVVMALTDYEAFVSSGFVKESPELDAAIVAVTKAQQEYAAGVTPLKVVNDAGLALAVAIAKARQTPPPTPEPARAKTVTHT